MRLPLNLSDDALAGQLSALQQQYRAGAALAVIFAGSLALNMQTLHGGAVWGWFAFKVLVTVVRVIHLRSPESAVNVRRTALIAYACLALDGAVWGVGGFWFVQTSPQEAAVVVASLLSVACVATFGLQLSSKATISFTIPLTAITTAGLVWSATPIAVYAGTGLGVVQIVMLMYAEQGERRFIELFEARKAQEAQSSGKSRLLATISHELRSPLHALIAMSQMGKARDQGADNAELFRLMEQTSKHLAVLADDLLDMAKLEAGTLAIQGRSIHLAAMFDEVMAVFRIRAAQSQQHVITNCALPPGLLIVADPVRIRQVLDNLLMNASKFTPRGGTIAATCEMVSGGIRFSVRDTGPGISEADQLALFQPYKQFSQDARLNQAGAGLGLSIAKTLVAALGGKIGCQSALGAGAEFWAELPAVCSLQVTAEPDDHRSQVNAHSQLQAQAGDGAVLVVDDEDVMLLVTQAQLEALGWRVQTAKNGADALPFCTDPDTRPQFVIMDCNMPVMSGVEAARRIRAWEMVNNRPRLTLIAATGQQNPSDLAACIEAGFDATLLKPYQLTQLTTAIAAASLRPTETATAA